MLDLLAPETYATERLFCLLVQACLAHSGYRRGEQAYPTYCRRSRLRS